MMSPSIPKPMNNGKTKVSPKDLPFGKTTDDQIHVATTQQNQKVMVEHAQQFGDSFFEKQTKEPWDE